MLKAFLVFAISAGLCLPAFCSAMARNASMSDMGAKVEAMSVANTWHAPVPSCCLGQNIPDAQDEAVSLPQALSETQLAIVPTLIYSVARPLVRSSSKERLVALSLEAKFESRSSVKRE